MLKMTKSAVIASEQSERGNPQKKQCYHLEFKQTPKFVILSAAKYP